MINSDDVSARALEIYDNAEEAARCGNPYLQGGMFGSSNAWPLRYIWAAATALVEAVNRELAVEKPPGPEAHPAGLAALDAPVAPPVELACGHPAARLVETQFPGVSFCQTCEALNRLAECGE